MNGFTFFRNYYEAITDPDNELTEAEQGRLYNAIFAYVFDGVEPELKGACRLAFNMIKPSLDVSKVRGEATRRKTNKNQNESNSNQNESNSNQNESNSGFDRDFTFFEKGEERREKKEERSSPPLYPPADGDSAGSGLRSFLENHENITVDNCSTASLDLDYAALEAEFSASDYLRDSPHQLSWVAKNADRILHGEFRGRKPPLRGKGDLQLWQELVRALQDARDEDERGIPRYRMADEEAKAQMGELYRGISAEIREYFDPNSFLELCEMDENDLKFERARFLKALPEIRQRVQEVRNGA